MALGWNEIKERAVKFSKEWADTCNEEADAQSFLVEFFNVFGISNRKVATFEHKVKKLDEHNGYIDLLWKGTILIEMKSRGKSLDKAYQQSKDYLQGLQQYELPKYILVSDFENFRLYDIDEDTETDFQLKDFIDHVHLFGFIAGYQKRTYKAEDPVNIEAAYLMGKLHDALKEAGYTGHELEKYLVRLLFCLFAEDTTIFEKNAFFEYLTVKTNEDGTDLGMHIAQLFQVLNTPFDERQKTLDESLAIFPYVNGQLFAEQLHFASFNSKMRQTLFECCSLDWSKISPAIFGSMFQSVMDETQRRNLGAHYTSEKNIQKLIKPLFLDKLWQEFEVVKTNRNKLKAFHQKIASLRFLDPACGCGNFLVITYRELRLLELEIIKVLQNDQYVTDVANLMLCDVDRFYGIEYEEFPAQIAQVALWLMDHQMNMLVSQVFGEYFVRLPLRKSAKIIHGNALRTDWDSMIELLPWESKTDREQYDYILGNPPFIGSKMMTDNQRNDIKNIFNNIEGVSLLDYVSGWYMKAAKYCKLHNINGLDSNNFVNCAFVSTNSITQGEQVRILWSILINQFDLKIHFAHHTFKWKNEAKGVAAVYCVIIGFSNYDINDKLIFHYDDIKGEPQVIPAKNINSYLVDARNIIILKRTTPIFDVPPFIIGSKPLDGGHLCLSPYEKDELIKVEPYSKKFIRPIIGAREFLYDEERYCLWLTEATPSELRNMKYVMQRIKAVKEDRERGGLSKMSCIDKPHLFGDNRQPKSNFLVIPKLSSENRRYIPMGFFDSNTIVTDLVSVIPNATIYHFGILTSAIHMAWVKYTCGRFKSDFRYTNLVYNNYPWPENPTDKYKNAIEKAAQKVLDSRAVFPDSCLADLYDPNTMPPILIKAHQELDKAVDLAYRPQPFINETKRIEFLFELYDRYTAGLFAVAKKKKRN